MPIAIRLMSGWQQLAPRQADSPYRHAAGLRACGMPVLLFSLEKTLTGLVLRPWPAWRQIAAKMVCPGLPAKFLPTFRKNSDGRAQPGSAKCTHDLPTQPYRCRRRGRLFSCGFARITAFRQGFLHATHANRLGFIAHAAFAPPSCAAGINSASGVTSIAASIGNGAVAVSATRGRSECGMPLCVST